METGNQGRQEDVGDQGHDGNVHIRAVDVIARREIPTLLPVGSDRLLARPGLMPPREQDEEELVQYVAVADIEVVL